MAETEDAGSDISELLATLRERVEQRRADGMYPPGLEKDLDAHFERIVAQRVEANIDEVVEALGKLEHSMNFAMERIPADSTMPGGEKLHRALAKAQARQIVGVLSQVSEFAAAVRETLDAMASALASSHSHVHGDLVGQMDAVLERVASYDRAPEEDAGVIADLRHRVEALEEAERARQFNPWFTNARFEDAFRGSVDDLTDRYRALAQTFGSNDLVIDIGCGRGEFLELLREEGIACIGVELDPALVEEARGKGLNVEHDDGLAFLRRCDDASLAGIVLIQVIEHLSQQGIVDLVALARDKLLPGGRVVCETVNPQSLYVFAHAFYVDPTHTRPVHPAYLSFLFSEAGFSGIKIDWRSPPPDDDMLSVDGDADSTEARNVERLNRLLFAPQDFAITATR